MATARGSSEPTGIRKFINENPVLVIAVLVVVVGGVMAVVFWPGGPATNQQSYYSADDGKTFFVHEFAPSPITYEGKEAYIAQVFSCDKGTTKFVGYLLRHTEKGRQDVAEKIRKSGGEPQRGGGPMPPGMFEVKKPGEGNSWVLDAGTGPAGVTAPTGGGASQVGQEVNQAVNQYTSVVNVKCPDGKTPSRMAPGFEKEQEQEK